MASYNSPARKRVYRAMDGALLLLVVLLIVQVWLLMASVESWLAGHRDVALPAALISGGLFGCALALMAFMRSADRKAREQQQN